MEILLKSSALIAIFLLFYHLFLSKETFYIFNRVFLLFGLIISISIPFVIIPIQTTMSLYPNKTVDIITSLNNFTGKELQNSFESSNLPLKDHFFGMIYFWGVFITGLRLIISILILRTRLQNQTKNKTNKYNLIEIPEDISPFSFFNNIVYNPIKYTDEELDNILQHEKTHVNQWHTLDMLITNILKVILWFNPFIYLYNKAIEQNLEFIADSNVNQLATSSQYEFLLLKSVVPAYQLQIVNNFFTSPIKKRINMINAKPSNPINKFKYLVILPILSLFLYSFNTKEILKITVQTSLQDNVTFIHPIKEHAKILSKFGERMHPILKVKKFHRGIDYKVKNHTEVIASENGIVKLTGNNKTDGEFITISHNNDFETRYTHLSKVYVQKNQRVFQGQTIGLSGNSGKSTAPHLHFEIIHDGKYIDPESVLSRNSKNTLGIKRYFKSRIFNFDGKEKLKIVSINLRKRKDSSKLLYKNNLTSIDNDEMDVINLSDSSNLILVFKKGENSEPGVLLKMEDY